ncbi:MAG: ribonuclease III [Chloroflexi bacterium]|nr:ribonuclease III [Chloroflexota bacterium]MCI0574825.1 ribonuclease III [Chloroflexota bacterium]MCI0645957.1 ribonuclease III [Chloroflexota bacterium]MCI0727600.1 ribonuclease III [Chloroflexota bacterium]
MADLEALETRLGIHFKDYSLLSRALTHRSFLNENPEQALEDNERLEFLGDAVLDFVVGAYLYHRFPEMKEGELTMLRAALVRARTLADFARQLGIGDCLQLGYGEAESGGRERVPTLCATFEAVIGAMYLDQGLPPVQALVQNLAGPALDKIMADSLHRDAKSEFQIWAQARYNVTPRYQVLAAEGPDHAKIFTVAVLLENETWGVGHGRSKQAAAQMAATAALERAETTEDSDDPDLLLLPEEL